MANYLLVFYGLGRPSSPAEQKKSMDDWAKWFAGLGKALADKGGPTMPGKMVTKSGIKAGAIGEAISGYLVLTAVDLNAAVKIAATAPGFDAGLKVTVYPVTDVTTVAPRNTDQAKHR